MFIFASLIVMTVATSFICALVETTLISITPSYLRRIQKKDETLAANLKLLVDQFEHNQSALAGVSTLLIVFGSALIGVQVSEIYGSSAVPLASLLTAITMVALTQVLPRAIGSHYWPSLCHFTLSVLPAIKLFAAPFTLMSKLVQKFGLHKFQEPVIRSEIETITEQGFKDGAIEASEYQLLNNVLEFKKWRLIDIMKQRSDLCSVDPDMTIDEAHDIIRNSKNNKFPLFGADHNETVGYVKRADIAEAILNNHGKQSIRKLARPILTVPHNMRARKLLTKFRTRDCEIALIIDDYGEVIGMVAQEDMLETLLDQNENLRRAA
ncbi:MAG: hypothetical protein COW01_04520 [Bdellovibrionales bacterium CG12_big_fil_rev_8_21_14_0_65_38_15]|nr:MAG: hypothetical protein COW79_11840 [Bdellovibrionales bacterium CG22_combo_CG10-13_8_21_14_all_38_13]PIQ56322.1 MAG: hypothetical protein COW01_04520 [Bdellovibrionales bacterium CG12_big_fil_rev_8_21_14_0_65_38_15]PIR29353.1 MAG: hypothetical protein COV38_11455 [Bdellovibrionales bacterium CG11_big_fil_rev_8_21_14_0_20_38_13]